MRRKLNRLTIAIGLVVIVCVALIVVQQVAGKKITTSNVVAQDAEIEYKNTFAENTGEHSGTFTEHDTGVVQGNAGSEVAIAANENVDTRGVHNHFVAVKKDDDTVKKRKTDGDIEVAKMLA